MTVNVYYDMTKRVVILGAGYGGAFLATNLAGSDMEVTLVDKKPYHELIQELHLVATGFRKPEETRIPISSLVSGTGVRFVRGMVKGIHLQENKVLLLDSGSISYDVLVVALGASTEYFDVPGAEKYTQPLRSIYDAKKIHEHIMTLVSSDNRGEISVVGGGATGVSIAGALADLVASEAPERVSIKVIEAAKSLLPGLDSKVLAKRAMEILQKKGVDVLLDARVTECLPGTTRLQSGKNINASMTIWTAGVRAYELDTLPTVTKIKNGRILVNEFCQLEGMSNVYAIGDIAAAVKSDKSDGFYPATAQVAIRQAKYLSERFTGSMEGAFDYKVRAYVLSLGVDEYILSLGDDYIVAGSLAKLVEEFSKDSYRRTIESGGSDVHSNVYGQDLFSKVLSGVTFAGFAFMKAIGKA